MLKNILVYLGLRSAPTPLRTYAAMSRFGFVPVAAFFAWQNRAKIVSLVRRFGGNKLSGKLGALGRASQSPKSALQNGYQGGFEGATGL